MMSAPGAKDIHNIAIQMVQAMDVLARDIRPGL